jgi:hypothetical protein
MPVSEHSQITVKLISPGLSLPEQASTIAKDVGERHVPVSVSEGVLAQWEGADEPGFDLEALGKDGKFNWVCTVPAQGKINLLLSWEVITPVRAIVHGL